MTILEQRLEGLSDMMAKSKDSILRRASSPDRKAEGPARCFRCNEEGHNKRDCPNKKQVSFKVKQVDERDDLNDSGSDQEA